MGPLNLILGSHNSQALDISSTDRNALYEHAYKPLLKLLYNHPDTNFTLYMAGPIIAWLEKHHSEFVDVLTEMVRRRQVELLGGAYYEPFLPLVPKVDRIGQLEHMTTYIRKCFGRRPRGAWVPESVWDQRIAANFSSGGIEYAFLDEGTFGLCAEPSSRRKARYPNIYGPILTEDQGKTLVLFPLTISLSEDAFVEEPARVVRRLRRISERMPRDAGVGVPVVTLMFDGARIGLDEGRSAASMEWLQSLLEEIATAGDWLRVTTPYRIMRKRPALDRRYAPVRSFDELMSWTEHLDDDLAPPPGTSDGWRSFRSILEAYPESQRLYARMQHTHVLVNQVRGDKYRKMAAREELWRGQSHYAYWHNAYGGIYRASLRKAAYRALIDAELTAREKGLFIPALSRLDVDLDGDEEVLYQGNELNAYLHARGGYLFELDWLSRSWNYLDTMQRQSEFFHDETTRAAGYDDWPRGAFVDHLLTHEQTRIEFAAGRRTHLCDVARLQYSIETLDKEHNLLVFAATCASGDSLVTLGLTKEFTFAKNRIDVTWTFENRGLEAVSARFATEVNLSFHSLEAGALRLHLRQGRQRRELPPDAVEAEAISELTLHDLHNSVALSLNPNDRPDLWAFPVEAVGILGTRPHWFYQSSCMVLVWPLELAAGASQTFATSMKIENQK